LGTGTYRDYDINGDYVEYDDHVAEVEKVTAKLNARVAELEAENARLRSACGDAIAKKRDAPKAGGKRKSGEIEKVIDLMEALKESLATHGKGTAP
jgi:non-homologous end joining protein Ku